MAKAAQFDESFVGTKPDMAPSMALLNVNEELRGSSSSLHKRSMILDEDRFESQFLRCQLCKEKYQQGRLPRLLPCHHCFCQTCIEQLFESLLQERRNFQTSLSSTAPPVTTVKLTCPSCQRGFTASAENIRKLPCDHRIVQLMDFVSHTDHYTVTLCSKHNSQPLNFFCDKCVRPVCRDCTISDHDENEGHNVVDLEAALTKYTPILDNEIVELDTELSSLEEKQQHLNLITASLGRKKADLIEQIRSTMVRLRERLKEREKLLENKVCEEIENERKSLIEKADTLSNRQKTVKSNLDRLRSAKSKNNVEEMFDAHQEVKEFRLAPCTRIREVDDGMANGFTFNIRDESMLSSRINTFGDIVCKTEPASGKTKTSFLYRSTSSNR